MDWFKERKQQEPRAETRDQYPGDAPGHPVGVGRDDLEQRLTALEEETRVRLNRQLRRLDEHTRELDRIGPQVAALEARLEHIRKVVDAAEAGVPRVDAAAPGRTVEATDLLTEIRRQHEQVRARISAATRYEERLRRVEEHLAPGS